MNKKTTFHLARHGQTQWNIEQRIQGQLDSPLTDNGIEQAIQLATQCESLAITQIVTSSLGRATQTAQLCALQLQVPVNTLLGIEERHFGSWQGRLTPDMASHPDYTEITSQVTDCKPLQGESALQLVNRFETALKKQFKQLADETYLVISHGDVLRCFMAQFLAQQSKTGYDYKNGHLLSFYYDHQTNRFGLL